MPFNFFLNERDVDKCKVVVVKIFNGSTILNCVSRICVNSLKLYSDRNTKLLTNYGIICELVLAKVTKVNLNNLT